MKLGCKASEMESAALFIVAVPAASVPDRIFFVMGNQERNGMEKPHYARYGRCGSR